MSFWSGRSQNTLRDRFVAYGGFNRIKDMQTQLLEAGGKAVYFWTRLKASPELCTCAVNNNMPSAPHSICYGTGFVNGYLKYGYQEWIIYLKNNATVRLWDGTVGIDIPIIAGVAISDWINASTLQPSMIEFQKSSSKSGAVVEFSNGGTFSNSLIFPTRFKIKITNIDSRFECVRFRGPSLQSPTILFSESPPRRMEQLLRQGLQQEPFDIRCWTIGGPIMTSGDVLKWAEGHFTGYSYVAVGDTISQFPTTNTASDTLTQILNMRRVKPSEQLEKLW